MYLSRLILNPRSRRVQREIAEPYQMHRTLMRAFPDGLHRERDRVLFRLETGRTGAPLVLLQSTLPPRWDWLDDDGARGYLLRPPETKAFDLHLAAGQMLAFRLRANPTVKRKFPNGDHKRVGIYDEPAQIEWLKRKGEQGGFHLLTVRTGGHDTVDGVVHRDEQKHQLNLFAVQFDGRLQVTDPERLRQTVRQGVGSGKGLGFGLLSLARPT